MILIVVDALRAPYSKRSSSRLSGRQWAPCVASLSRSASAMASSTSSEALLLRLEFESAPLREASAATAHTESE